MVKLMQPWFVLFVTIVSGCSIVRDYEHRQNQKACTERYNTNEYRVIHDNLYCRSNVNEWRKIAWNPGGHVSWS